jgi:hypothetical protein
MSSPKSKPPKTYAKEPTEDKKPVVKKKSKK